MVQSYTSVQAENASIGVLCVEIKSCRRQTCTILHITHVLVMRGLSLHHLRCSLNGGAERSNR